jgi:BMFP domain-containing protein YqiC
MALANKLGKSYAKVQAETKLKTIHIDLEEVKFDLKVRVPLKKEMETITATILSPDQARVDKIFKRLSDPMIKAMEEGGEEFVKAINDKKQTLTKTDDDLIVDGTSVRQVANFSAIEENKVEQYFHLLVSETGEPITETYEQIVEEFPEFVIREIVAEIDKAIKPDYKTVKKN